MDLQKVIRERRSVRSFKKDRVPEAKLRKALQAALLAPSGSNRKNWRVVVIRDDRVKERMKEAVEDSIERLAGKIRSPRAKKDLLSYSRYFTFFSDAPVVIAFIRKPYDSLSARLLKRYDGDADYTMEAGVQNTAAAVENLLLACCDLGLGACWMTGPMIARGGLEDILGTHGEETLMALVPVGFPERKSPANRPPRSFGDMVEYM